MSTSTTSPVVITSDSTLVRDENGNVTVTGVCSPGASIEIFVDNGAQPVITVTVDNAGDFTATFPLDPGPHTIRAVDGTISEATQLVTVQ